MTQSAQPLGAKPATITVRVKTLVVIAALMLVAAAAVLGLRWVTGMRPLVAGASGTGPIGLSPLPGTNGESDTGPPVYEWQRDGRFVITLWLHNSASVPVTVTGADHTPADWVGQFTGPALGIPDIHAPISVYAPFHPLEIPADGTRGVTFIFRANPRACGNQLPNSTGSIDSLTVHFTALGLFRDSQTIALSDGLYLAGPTAAACKT